MKIFCILPELYRYTSLILQKTYDGNKAGLYKLHKCRDWKGHVFVHHVFSLSNVYQNLIFSVCNIYHMYNIEYENIIVFFIKQSTSCLCIHLKAG